jgi:cell division protein FtsI/penicillin-binding protein 2
MSLRSGTKQFKTTRLFFISVIFCIIAIVAVSYLFVIQIKNHKNLTAQAQSIQETKHIIQPKRGLIYFQDKNHNLISVAINKNYTTIYAVPKEIQQANKVESTAKILSDILKIDYNSLLTKFSKINDEYEIVYAKIDDAKLINQIEQLKLKGIYVNNDELDRYYPLGELGAHIIGFVGETKETKGEKTGQYGLEKFYNNVLEGQTGLFKGVRDAFGRLVRSLTAEEEPVNDGSSLITSIDKNIQYKAEEELEKLLTTRLGSSGSIIIMEPKTGKIVALANWPTYNLNEYSKVKDYKVYKNVAVEEALEIGSVMKVITMSAAIDSGAVQPDTKYIDKGSVTIDKKVIKNFHNEVYGECDMNKVLEQSINTGAIFAEQRTGNKIFLEYLKRFKLNEKTGIDLPNEALNDIHQLELGPKDARDVYFATASFGHGIKISPISLVRAYATIANKGILVNPYIVEAIVNADGSKEDLSKQISEEQVIKPETVQKITQMMVGVVERGYGKNAKIKGYDIAGKTGTADIATQGSYSEDTIQSFIGFFPAYNPQFVILVKLDKPKIGTVASATVTYTFRNMVQFLINYYNIPPDHE